MIWIISSVICIHSHGHISGSTARLTLPSIPEKDKARMNICMRKNLYVYSSGWIRSIEPKIKKVVFITNQCHMKNIRDANKQYTRRLIASLPILKAYNHRMGGVDKHDRLVGHHAISLTSKRGYLKVFFHVLDSALVNAWILFKASIDARGE